MTALELQHTARPVQGHATCRLCSTPLHHTFVDLGMSPLCERFLTATQLDEMEPFYPLHAFICERCHLVQLNDYVSPETIFTEYAYFSSYSTSWVAHARAYCRTIARRMSLGPQSLVVELASNDGYLLQHFLPMRIPVLGIEPAANVARAAIAKGIPTRVEFFGATMARRLAAEGKRADLVVANNVLAQVPDLNDFVAGVQILLKTEGVATIEVPHIAELISGNQFDTIYHEHFSYFSGLSIAALAERHSLRMIDVEHLPTHGGSLRVYLARKESTHPAAASVAELLHYEREQGLDSLIAFRAFAKNVERTKRDLLALLISAKRSGKRICGYGAPGKSTTLLNYCGIGTDFLEFTVDRNPYKHGRFTPGVRIPIRSVEAIDRARPDYVFILPWNLKDEIAAQMRHISNWGGKFIVPIPHPVIIDPRCR